MESLDDRFIDPDIERAFKWLLSFLPAGEWDRRRAAIDQHLEVLFKPKPSPAELTSADRLIGTRDRTGWYLYLIETSLYQPFRTEVNQAARVLPLFKRLGCDLEVIKKLGNIELQAAKMLGPSKDQPDSVLFEILIGLLWARNGWGDVSFIPASKTEKRPDFRAANGSDEWFVETKKLVPISGYSQKEREKWLKMWGQFKDCLIRNGYPFILDITFHVELVTLDDDFVLKQLENKLKLVTGPTHLISDDIWDVGVNLVDFNRVKRHLDDQYVKTHSRQLQELLGGSWDRKKGFTHIMKATNVRMGGDRGINQYVEDIAWAAGAYWHCDAERSKEAKARDIRPHLSDAVEQLPASGRGVIHVGIETPDGEDVEEERLRRIVHTTSIFDALGKDLRWVYCHLYESHAPPTTSWVIDETVIKIAANKSPNPEPISMHMSIQPSDMGTDNSVHWLREAP